VLVLLWLSVLFSWRRLPARHACLCVEVVHAPRVRVDVRLPRKRQLAVWFRRRLLLCALAVVLSCSACALELLVYAALHC
jgi:hypothetical protein